MVLGQIIVDDWGTGPTLPGVEIVYGAPPPIDLTDPTIIVEGRPVLPDWITPVAIGGAVLLAVLFLSR